MYSFEKLGFISSTGSSSNPGKIVDVFSSFASSSSSKPGKKLFVLFSSTLFPNVSGDFLGEKLFGFISSISSSSSSSSLAKSNKLVVFLGFGAAFTGVFNCCVTSSSSLDKSNKFTVSTEVVSTCF